MTVTLRRYTELPYVVDMLQTKQIVLLNPQSWDDRNDSFFIEQYARRKGFAKTYALCLAQAPETYHHWKVFSHGSGGVCIQFDRNQLTRAVKTIADLRAEDVRYETIKRLRKQRPQIEDLPFLKRYAYKDELEFRIFHASTEMGDQTLRIPIPLSAIQRITLSPWMPREVAKSIAKTLKLIEGCSKLAISRSTLVENEEWKTFAANGA